MHVKRGLYLSQVNKLSIIAFLSTISLACIATIWSIYLESIIHNSSYVGILIGSLTIVGLVSFIFLTPLVEETSKSKLFFYSLIFLLLFYIGFIFFSNIWIIILLSVFLSIVGSLRISCLGIMICDKANRKNIAKEEGLIYTFFNLSWLVGPLIAGFISARYGFKSVFGIASLFLFLSILLFIFFRLKDNRITKKIDGNLFKLIKEFFSKKNRIVCYILSGGINFWWAFIYVYIPILIIEKGFTSRLVGIYLFSIIIPLILFTYFFGKLASKIGFKKIFFTGYLIIGIFALACFFVENIYLIIGFLTLASVGASMVESTSEAYFFDIIKKNQRDRFYGIYNTTIDVNQSIASFIGAGILFVLPFKFMFLFFAIVMFLISLVSLGIKNIIESRRR